MAIPEISFNAREIFFRKAACTSYDVTSKLLQTLPFKQTFLKDCYISKYKALNS
jgi:hypothetical protein